MKTYMAFPICSLIFILLVSVVYFLKPRIKTIENGIYKWLVVVNIIGLILELFCYYAVDTVDVNYLLSIGILKMYVVYIFVWSMIFNCYVYIVSYKKYTTDDDSTKMYFNILKKVTVVASTIVSVVLLLLPIQIYNDGKLAYTYGPITNVLIVACFIIVSTWIIKCFINFKNLKQKRYIPVVACIIVLSIVLAIQSRDRSILIATTGHSFIVLLMFFTIENPDVKMINELNKNRELVNKTFEDKSNFLFITSNQLKTPLKKIEEISRDCIDKNKGDMENIRDINNLSNNLLFQVNNVMDISSLTYSNIKVINEKYNLNILLNKIRLSEENKVKDGVKFNVNVNELVPKYLYGDSKLLEQVIISLVENAIKYTNSGFIDFNVDCIVKYDMCRLIFTVEDSGLGMTIDKVNELLLVDSDLSNEELKRLDTKNININTIKKLVNKLGGYFTIKSEVGKGTEIKVVVDQKIESDEKINFNNYSNVSKVLVASSNLEFTNHLLKIFDKRGYAIDTSAYSNDILDKVRLNNNYSYIFIDDAMDKRAIEILKELKKNPKFNTKVIVMIDKSLELIKDDLIKDGFYDCIFKEEIDKELERIPN